MWALLINGGGKSKAKVESAWSGECSANNIKYPISNIKYPISNIQYPISNIQYPISNIQYQISNIKYQISNIKYQISNIQYPISNLIDSKIKFNYKITSNTFQMSWIWFKNELLHRPTANKSINRPPPYSKCITKLQQCTSWFMYLLSSFNKYV